jgi:hypothetical protein
VGIEENSGATVDDVVRALNTKLIAGKGPDLLVLDGLPLESYIGKGVLKDISALAGRLAAEQDLFGNLTDAYAFDGKLYGLPTRFALPVMVGDKAALSGFASLSALVEAVKAAGDKEPYLLRAPDNLYGNNRQGPGGVTIKDPMFLDQGSNDSFLMSYYEACVESFTNAGGSLDEAALAAYFADMVALSDALKAVTPETQNRMVAFGTMGGGRGERIDMGSMDIADGTALTHIQQLSGLMNLMSLSTNIGGMDGMTVQSLFGQLQYYPRGGIGITAAGKQQALAESFFEILFSAAVQDNYLYDAFPVNRGSLRKMLGDMKELMRTMGNMDFNDMGFVELCEGLTIPVLADERVKSAAAAQAQALLDGTVSPEEAAARVVADTRLYLAE